MKAMFWVMGGWVMISLSGVIEVVGDRGASPSERLPIYLLTLFGLLGAAFCFAKAGRAIWDTISGKNRDRGRSSIETEGGARAARRLADMPPQSDPDGFDADAAFARYMARRGAQESEPAASEPPPQPSAPRGFGRKGI